MLRERVHRVGPVANYSTMTVTLTGTGDPEPVAGEIVSPEYFPLLVTKPLLGRGFVTAEDEPGGQHPVAILGFDLWKRRFAGDSGVVGRTVGINGVPLTVVGVMQPGFRGLTDRAQLWIPTTMAPSLTYAEYLTTNQNFISVAARLRPGITLEPVSAARSP